MRDKLIDALNGALKDYVGFVPLDATIKIADQLIAEGFGLVEARGADFGVPCKLGDVVFVPYYHEETGVTEIEELKVTEVSEKRIWVCGDDDFDYRADDIGKSVFLSRDAAEAYIVSPEYLAERVNWVLLLNVSDNAKKEMLVKVFGVGQEYFEQDTERYIRLTDNNPAYIWGFDVFDSNKELAYSTSALAVQLANDILEGYIIPAYTHEQAQMKVADVIADAKTRVEHEPARGKEETLGL